MEIRIRETGQVMFLDEFRRIAKENDIPFWYDINEFNIIDHDVDIIFEGPQANTVYPYEFSMRQGIEQQNDGKWYTKYIAGPIFVDIITDGVTVTAAEQETAYKARRDAEQSVSVRQIRNQYLSQCDWTQSKDIPDNISSVWATYRQALRDITAQQGFPWNVEWPAKPE